ncbi:hypothetical protein O6H91_17G070100 [Diphasiastrum complanatum]|uniref:Uncharacterized protein n=4 Tax=Diphasiastrum complanatum TaxID=34168 RepID=A0ACC2B7Y3_DIPCM|nr:hypothetical protein O6H91_17G070100 [Diphasiastrum complanatum]KAJ7525849.1 hypothetical protein O6H91_17G070100 [Diphasiastrum complanatum]KAJ7525850.1 hypothetical protein O6H91_17G070100 [Diphasiastrum complanatum]KAJ7525851.1 hypothetical protein O6H91_17G070100 [Diphasiastrum complanatum]
MGQFLSCVSGAKKDLHDAIKEGNVEYVEQVAADDPGLLQSKYSYWRYSPLHAAAARGNLQILTLLLERGTDINARDRSGRTPLMISCLKARWNCVQLLLDNGADVLIFSSYLKLTCLHYAAKAGHADSVQKILTVAKLSSVESSWGAKRFVNVRNRYGASALHLAARKGHCAVVRLLLEHGALVSATTYTFGNDPGYGSTALHLAAHSGSVGCVQELLAWGADRNQMDHTGYTPYNIAVKHRNFTCAALLNPDSAEPLVWPSPLTFMREIDAAAKHLLEAALLEANETRQATDGASPSSATVRNQRGATPAQEIPTVERSETIFSKEGSSGMSGLKEVCCICFEEFCTIQVQDCGHQMCAVCTLTLCCHSKPNPDIPYSPPPACPFCRRDIAHLVLAPSKPSSCKAREETEAEEEEAKEKEKAAKNKLKRSRKGSRPRSHGSSGASKETLCRMMSGRSSGRIADAEWFREED